MPVRRWRRVARWGSGMSELLTWTVTYLYRTYPMVGIGREKTDTFTVAAADLMQAQWLARLEGERRYPRRKWSVLSCVEVAACKQSA